MAYIVKIFLFTSAYGYLSVVTLVVSYRKIKKFGDDLFIDKSINDTKRIIIDLEMSDNEIIDFIEKYQDIFKDCPERTELIFIKRIPPSFDFYHYLEIISQFFSST